MTNKKYEFLYPWCSICGRTKDERCIKCPDCGIYGPKEEKEGKEEGGSEK